MANKTVSPDDFKGKSLFITTPAYGGMVCSDFALSIAATTRMLGAFGVEHDLFFVNNDSLVMRARNVCVSNFIASDFTHMIFIDADTDFNAGDVIKFLLMNEDVLTGAVPMKKLPIRYNTTLVRKKDGKFLKHKDFFYEVEYTGTAFMMIKREVIQKMFDHYKDLKYEIESADVLAGLNKDDPNRAHATPICPAYGSTAHLLYALFDVQLHDDYRNPDGKIKRYYAEDYMFCKRWRDIGGKILLDPTVKLNHNGAYKFDGDLKELQNGPSITEEMFKA